MTDTLYLRLEPPDASATLEGRLVAADGSLSYEYKYGRQPEQVGREDTINVPMTPEKLPGATAKLVREKLPLTWRSLQSAR